MLKKQPVKTPENFIAIKDNQKTYISLLKSLIWLIIKT